jgi:hypothetical protein
MLKAVVAEIVAAHNTTIAIGGGTAVGANSADRGSPGDFYFGFFAHGSLVTRGFSKSQQFFKKKVDGMFFMV